MLRTLNLTYGHRWTSQMVINVSKCHVLRHITNQKWAQVCVLMPGFFSYCQAWIDQFMQLALFKLPYVNKLNYNINFKLVDNNGLILNLCNLLAEEPNALTSAVGWLPIFHIPPFISLYCSRIVFKRKPWQCNTIKCVALYILYLMSM